ncbi:MAG: RsmD family RNA methyltransferase, partial [Paracoccaceae bacterium]
FNLLINGGYGDPVTDALVLDLFAGTGALGLEAISRGAASALLVDDGATALALQKRNVALMKTDAVASLRRDAMRLGANPGEAFTLVFLDPPYGKGMGEKALQSAVEGGWLAQDALIVWEESTPPLVPAHFTQLDQRRYGDTLVTILRAP